MNKKINIPEFYVSDFNKSFKDIVESNFSYVRIKGEISELKPASKGQLYLTLKDKNSILSGVIWENKKKHLAFNPDIGIEVIATGKITTWSRFKTTYQIDIDNLEIAGEGALLKLIEERKNRLSKKGFFDKKNKKNIPYLPSKLGIITSPTGSVIHDILKKLKERYPIDIDIWPVLVQGSESVNSIISALRGFNNKIYDKRPDIIIIARGGGSTEDLMPFNDENLATEVFKSKIPIISAIGHETDNTIIDLVSDLRASTPTAAAEIIVPLKNELEKNILNLFNRMEYIINNNYKITKDLLSNLLVLLKAPNNILISYQKNFRSTINSLNKQVSLILEKSNFIIHNLSKIKSPDMNLKFKKNELKKIYINLEKNVINNNNNYKNKFFNYERLLNSNSINNNLKKGYVILNKSKKIIKNSKEIKKNDNLSIKFYDNTIGVNIKKIN